MEQVDTAVSALAGVGRMLWSELRTSEAGEPSRGTTASSDDADSALAAPRGSRSSAPMHRMQAEPQAPLPDHAAAS